MLYNYMVLLGWELTLSTKFFCCNGRNPPKMPLLPISIVHFCYICTQHPKKEKKKKPSLKKKLQYL